MKLTRIASGLLAAAVVALAARPAVATPSTQIWIPSTDVQDFGTLHLTYDIYARPGKSTILMLGPTVGVSPFEKLEVELGFDLMFLGNKALDDYPIYFNGKIGTPEDALFAYSPAIAFGVYNAGVKPGLTTQNVGYGLVARTLPVIGRISAGYYLANERLLVDETGREANHGLLLSWDRAMPELSDKLWFGVDYQGGRSAFGALNAGMGWTFSDNVGVIVGYDYYLNREVAGLDTFTVQLDVNLGQ